MERLSALSLAVALVGVLHGCAPADTRAIEPPADLAAVQIPAGFDFATTRSVRVQLRSSRPRALALRLETPEGLVLYRGGLATGGQLDRTLMLPRATASIAVVTSDGVSEERVAVAVTADGVDHAL